MQLVFRARFFREFSFADTIRRCCRVNNFQARIALSVDCTNTGCAFLASPFPLLFNHIQFALVQLVFRARVCREFARISIDGIIRRCCRMNNFQARIALCVDCTNAGFAFLASTFPQLLAHIQFALVQLLFRGRFCREFTQISFPTLYGDAAGWTISKLISLCALIAQTQGLLFWPPYSHSFLLIYNLH